MTSTVPWTLADVLPQKPPMVLLDGITEHSGDETVCTVKIEKDSLFATADGSIPCWVALEFMAQCAAAHSGINEREKGKLPRLGFLLGSRHLTFHVASFEPGSRLRVSAKSTWTDGELASFACSVHDEQDKLLAECELSAYSPHNIQDMLTRQNA